MPRRGGHQRRRRRHLGPLVRVERQEEDVLRLRRPGPGSHPEGRPAQRPSRRLHQQGVGPGPLLLRLAARAGRASLAPGARPGRADAPCLHAPIHLTLR